MYLAIVMMEGKFLLLNIKLPVSSSVLSKLKALD